MARTLTWRLRVLSGTAVAIAALASAACSSNATPGSAPTNPTGTGNGAIGGAPSSTATTPAASPTGGGGGGGQTSSPLYPKDAKSYGLEVLKAWMNKDFDRLATLAQNAGVAQIKDSVTYQGLPDPHWTYISCGAGENPDTTTCIYRNAHGDEVDMTMTTSMLGHPLAEVSAMETRTQYPADPGQYVSNLMGAWGDGNIQRVLRLSNSTVRSKLDCTINGANWTTTPGSPNATVIYNGHGGNAGSPDYSKTYTFTVLNSPGGKANAVKSVTDISCT